MQPTVLTLDVGTTSVKVSQYTPELRPLCCFNVEYAVDATAERAEVPVSRYLDAIQKGIAQMPFPESTAVIGITTQGETLLPVSADGIPLRNAIVWLDCRAGAQADSLRQKLGSQRFYETTGLPEISASLPLCKLQWLREEEPNLYAAAHKFLLLEDYLLYWLTGRFVSEKSLQSSTGWFNIRRDCLWAEALEAAGVDRGKLPEFVECGKIAGRLLPARAAELRLPENVLVSTGAMDQTAAALAAGCTKPGTVAETTGTALVVAACTDSPIFRSDHRVTIYRHTQAGQYLYLPIGNTAGMALKWFRSEFCRELPTEAAYSLLDEEAETIPCGCEGLLFLPYLSGCVDPDFLPKATGCFFGARLSTTRAHFVRALMEAVGYQLRDFLSLLDSLGCSTGTVASLGGGARSGVWMQMKADICERPFKISVCTEAASTGAAILAAQAAGLRPAIAAHAAESEHVYTPQPDNFLAYRTQYQRVKALYNAVKPLYEQE